MNAFVMAGTENSNRSTETEACLDCHSTIHPGIVEDWMSSRHAMSTPQQALAKKPLERRISNENVPVPLKDHIVGCFECHGLNTADHQDRFDHFGYQINVIVSPRDCQACHSVEAEQYSRSIKAHAVDNLALNPIYNLLVETIIGLKEIKGADLMRQKASHFTERETCYGCHGTRIEVKGLKIISTEDMDVEVPVLTGWPNQGVGRMNPDGSRGACTSCHPRHAFSLKDARKPYTCSQCHLEPDVPAYNVYKESKHGNIFEARGDGWNYENVPWVIGKDFKTPTCAGCHNSLLTDPFGTVIAERTHLFDSRIWERIFGLIYSHPQPKDGATHQIKNADGLPLPSTFDGRLATDFLIDSTEKQSRQRKMENICQSCHSSDWVQGHFEKFDNTTNETNAMVLAATQLLQKAWKQKLANDENPFDEEIEMLWVRQWLYYANSVRHASAMTGAPDYAAFKNGWFDLELYLNVVDC